jgi:hypothetical protein
MQDFNHDYSPTANPRDIVDISGTRHVPQPKHSDPATATAEFLATHNPIGQNKFNVIFSMRRVCIFWLAVACVLSINACLESRDLRIRAERISKQQKEIHTTNQNTYTHK